MSQKTEETEIPGEEVIEAIKLITELFREKNVPTVVGIAAMQSLIITLKGMGYEVTSYEKPVDDHKN